MDICSKMILNIVCEENYSAQNKPQELLTVWFFFLIKLLTVCFMLINLYVQLNIWYKLTKKKLKPGNTN